MRRSVYLPALLLSLMTSAGQAQSTRDTLVRMSDDVVLDALYCMPATPPPSGGYPAIVWVHGFAGSKNDTRASAMSYAQRGFVCVAYSVRGQGSSQGEFDFFTSTRVLEDLRAFIDMAKALPDVNDTRVGVVGGSQGGIHAWAAAAHQLGARTVVSVIANGRFDENWLENNALNWTFASAILAANVRFKAGMKDSVNKAITGGDYTYLRSLLSSYSTLPLETSTTTPTLILVSYFDGFFNQSSALKQFARITSPKRVVTYPAGHALPSHPLQRSFVTQLQDRWLDYWLKDNTADTDLLHPDSAVVMYDAITNLPHTYAMRDSAAWLDSAQPTAGNIVPLTLFPMSGTLSSVAPPSTETKTVLYSRATGSTPIVYRSEPLIADLVLAGRPAIVRLTTDGTAGQYQFVVNVYDYNPATSISAKVSRGHYQIVSNGSGQESIEFPLTSVAATLRAGHRIELRVHCGMPLIPNQNDFGNYVLGPVDASVNTLTLGGGDPSRITLFAITGPASAEAIPHAPIESVISISPNPIRRSAAVTRTTLDITSRSTNARVDVYDALGRLVASPWSGTQPGSHFCVFNAEGLTAGTYVAVLRDGTSTSTSLILITR